MVSLLLLKALHYYTINIKEKGIASFKRFKPLLKEEMAFDLILRNTVSNGLKGNSVFFL